MDDSAAVSLFDALAQDSRLAIFRLLVRAGPAGMNATTLSERLAIAPPTLSFHLRTLCQSRLVEVRRNGRFMIYRSNLSLALDLTRFLLENCCAENPEEGCLLPGTGNIGNNRKERL
ncbi:MAG: metalloregulator ArsR/SmtB family transcription factor [Nitrospirae bacterium]|jgi:DNA-binding transcriptional ArsR family regulator|nr:metalloregulator ArsR/SmtB family transcription factor [Nitrospirota bacterium]